MKNTSKLVLKAIAGVTAAAALAVFSVRAETAAAPEPDAERRAADKVFAAELEMLCAEAKGTPGQEAANFITGPEWVHELLLMLKGEKPATAVELARARDVLQGLAKTVAKGPKWPRPATVRAPFADSAPVVDGKLDDPAWAKVATFEGSFLFDQDRKLDDPKTVWRILWDEKYLYFAFDCADDDIRIPELKRDGPVYNSDCVEMFLLPDFAAALYWELEVSPGGVVFDALQKKKLSGWGSEGSQLDKNIEGLKVGCQVRGTPNQPGKGEGYTIEVAVPFDQLPGYAGRRAAAGQTFRFMLVHLDWNAKGQLKPYAFQPLLSWGHNIWNYATLELAGK